MAPPQTYNDERIDLKSREVFWKALEVGEKLLDEMIAGVAVNPEKLHAVAAMADAAYCGVEPQDAVQESY